MINNIEKAFVLGAGLGTRMRPVTNTIPKPLVQVQGRSLLDRTYDHLKDHGVHTIVVNTHHLPDKMTEAVRARADIKSLISYEPELLDTGGGIKKALDHFDGEPFFVLSGDGLWTDGSSGRALERMNRLWDPEIMDILILLQPLETFNLTTGVGDYDLGHDGRARRSLNRSGTHMFTSMRINHPRIFQGAPEGAFSYLNLLDAAERTGRLYGLIHDGQWHHISTVQDLENVNGNFKE